MGNSFVDKYVAETFIYAHPQKEKEILALKETAVSEAEKNGLKEDALCQFVEQYLFDHLSF